MSHKIKSFLSGCLVITHSFSTTRLDNLVAAITMSKAAKVDQDVAPLVTLFQSIGLTQAKALEAIKAPKSAAILKEVIDSNKDAVTGLEEKQATLIANLAVQLPKSDDIKADERNYVLKAILDSRLKNFDQITGRVYLSISPFHP